MGSMRSGVSAFGLVALSLATLTGCPMPESSATRMQSASSDFNTDVRFGRLSLAIDRVDPKEREAFIARRKAWGKQVEISDYELISAKMVGDEDADVVVKFDWCALATSELHSSKIRQHWHSHSGTWLLQHETLEDGSPGLLGEPVAEGTEHPRNAQFPTIRLGD
jgi:hypothetical protein